MQFNETAWNCDLLCDIPLDFASIILLCLYILIYIDKNTCTFTTLEKLIFSFQVLENAWKKYFYIL